MIGQRPKPAAAKPARRRFFKGIEDAKLSIPRLSDCSGQYLFKVFGLGFAETREHKPYVKMDGQVITTLLDGNGIEPGADGFAADQCHREGTEASHGFFMGDYFLKEIKGFIAAAFNYQPDDVSEEDACMVCGMDIDENPLKHPETGEEGYQPCYNMAIVADVEHKMIADEEKRAKAVAAKRKPYYTNVRFRFAVSYEDIVEAIGEEKASKYFPEGVNYVAPDGGEEEA